VMYKFDIHQSSLPILVSEEDGLETDLRPDRLQRICDGINFFIVGTIPRVDLEFYGTAEEFEGCVFEAHVNYCKLIPSGRDIPICGFDSMKKIWKDLWSRTTISLGR